MGYDMHITRRADWAGEEGEAIDSKDWLKIAAEDPEFDLSGENGPYFAVWRGANGSASPDWLDWSDGHLFSKNPSEAFRLKMASVAQRLEAKLQGDDGELYGPDGKRLPDAPSDATRQPPCDSPCFLSKLLSFLGLGPKSS